MVSSSLRQFLQTLCCDSPWDYAVFWRLQQHQSQMLLTWEDGLLDTTREPTKGITDPFSFDCSYERLSPTCQFSTQNGYLADSPLGVVVAEMSSISYLMGKGLVGEVAYTESPIWIYDDIIMARSSSNLISECPVELLHQFVVGIKTVLLVPLVPHGVLQLGSLDMVAEDAELIAYVKNKFDAHQQFAGYFSPYRLDGKFPVQPSDPISSYMENLGELSGITMNKIVEDLKVLDGVGVEALKNANFTNFMIENLHCIAQTDLPKVTDNGSETRISMQMGLTDLSEPFSNPTCETSESELTQNFFRSYLDEKLELLSFFSDYEMTHHISPVRKLLDSYSSEVTMEPSCLIEDYDNTTCTGIQILRFSTDSELHKALGSDFLDHKDLNLLQSAVSGVNATRSSVGNKDVIQSTQPSARDSGEQSTKENKVDYLLEAVVANSRIISDDSSSNRSHLATSLKASSGRNDSIQREQGALAGEDSIPWSCVTSVFSEDRDSPVKLTPSASSFDWMISGLVEEQLQRDVNDCMLPTKGSKLTGANKRMARLRDNQKPRPRDRQLIQDRIKELRQLVPDGTKCSIDGLLDRTIKHMQFLRNVTDQADIIRRHVLKEDSDLKDLKSHIVKGINHSGTSWALELGSEQQTCPVIVKDLEYPGHMLIEMMCNDNGRFMEIADVILRLGLTILKGVMERRSDGSTWAHFIVEASETFHRLDIFWPLMQLLQQNRIQISSKI